MLKVKNLKNIKNPEEFLKKLPGRGRNLKPPIPKEYYEDAWGVYATSLILQQSIAQYQSEKQVGESIQIFYKGKPLDIYTIPPEAIAFVKEKIRSLANTKKESNIIFHKKNNPKSSQWVQHLWK